MQHLTFAVMYSCFVACIAGFPTRSVAAEPEDSPLVLEVATIADNSAPALEFTARNTGQGPVLRHAPGVNGSSIVALGPGGRVVMRQTTVDDFLGKPPVIEPGETAIWYLRLDEVLEWEGMEAAGTYRLFWQIDQVRSREIAIVRDAKVWEEGRAPRLLEGDSLATSTPKEAVKAFLHGLDGNGGLFRIVTLRQVRTDSQRKWLAVPLE
jgi:hypothetical protein